jgi:6-phosphogluconolactonase
MNTQQVKIFKSSDDLYTAAAALFAETVNKTVLSRGIVHVALSGGSTPQGFYKLLSQAVFRETIPWDSIHFFWGDERSVPPDNVESNYGQARKFLLDHVPARQENIHRIQGEINPQQAAKDYCRLLAHYGDHGRLWPRFDWALLGLGADGHTASLFPGLINPGENSSPVIAVNANYMGRPAARVSLTPLVFNAARHVVFLVTGENKAPILQKILKGLPDLINLPAQRIQPENGIITWMIDASAAHLLS